MEEQKEKNIVYYGVYYATNGEIFLTSPQKDQESCFQILEEKMNKDQNGKFKDFCKSTTVIKRDLNTLPNPEFIFGCPKSLDIKNNPRKKK